MIKANLGMFLLICGSKCSQRRAAYVSSMAFKSKHRHIVFTIPAQLRFYFIKNRSLLVWLPFSTTENIADKSILKVSVK